MENYMSKKWKEQNTCCDKLYDFFITMWKLNFNMYPLNSRNLKVGGYSQLWVGSELNSLQNLSTCWPSFRCCLQLCFSESCCHKDCAWNIKPLLIFFILKIKWVQLQTIKTTASVPSFPSGSEGGKRCRAAWREVMMLFAFPLSSHHGWMHTHPSTTLLQLYEKDIQSFTECNLKPDGDGSARCIVYTFKGSRPLTQGEMSIKPANTSWIFF